MKKLLLTTVLFLGAYFVQAQETHPALQKGTFMLETGLAPFSLVKSTGFSYISNDNLSEWSVGGEAGYFATDKFAIKAGLGIYGVGFDGNTETAISYKAGIKYYVANQFPFQLDFGGVNTDGTNALILGAQAGYAWFLNDRVAIEPGVRYDHGLNDNASNIKAFSARIGFSLHF